MILLGLNNPIKIKIMLKEKLSIQEKQEASLVLEKYRAKYMCTVGPAFVDIIKNALNSDEGRRRFIFAGEQLFNLTYFKNKNNSGLPHSTREILGYGIWQSPCHVYDVKTCGDGSMLTGFMQGKVNVDLEKNGLNEKPIEDEFFKRENGDEGDSMGYTYVIEDRFCSMEQIFMFMRAFWYYIEAMVLFHVLQGIISVSVITQFLKYIELRRSLVLPFFHDNFPENHYYSKIDVQTSDELDIFYDKYLFSKMRAVQKKTFLLANVIANATK